MEYRLEIPCAKNQLKKIRNFLSGIMDKYDIPEKEAGALILAVDEVLANLIIHAHDCNPDDSLNLIVRVEGGKEFTFYIIDDAKGFDITRYKEPTLNELIQAKKKGGVGLILVRKIMDNIKLIKREGFSIYRLHKKFDNGF